MEEYTIATVLTMNLASQMYKILCLLILQLLVFILHLRQLV